MADKLDFTDKEFSHMEKIARYYAVTKELLIFTEQVDPLNRTLPQVINELRNCLDHLMRAFSVKLGLREVDKGEANKDYNYVEINLDKAYGHVYRAAYDTLDWLSLTLKDRIIDEIQEFSLDTIQAVLPEYFTEIKPRLEQILGDEVARLRTEKDVAAKSEENLVKYGQVTAELKRLFQTIINKKSALVEHHIRLKKARRKQRFWRIAETVALGVIIGLLLWLIIG